MKLYHYQREGRESIILEAHGGFGEIAPLPRFSKETLQEALQDAYLYIREKKPPRCPSLRFAIESAKKTPKAFRIPLCFLYRKKTPFPDCMHTLKVKVKNMPVQKAVELVKYLKKKARLRIDCNRFWSLEEACFFASHFSPEDFEYLEEPCRSEEELIAFSKKSGFPIALDESIHIDWEKIPTLKALVIKPTLLGKIPEVKAPLYPVFSSSYESGLGLISIANQWIPPHPIGLGTYFGIKEDLLINPIRIEKGYCSWAPSTPLIDFSKLSAL